MTAEMDTRQIRFPSITVRLAGEDGNIFFIAARVGSALREAKVEPEVISTFYAEVQASDSYDAALRVVMRWVSVI